mmetsp:Transcript_22334/g.34578  ORF Transcript_22334/g.34578 Transcript_22334/m.34578 type:complete len:152 (-) Transcript_22334:2030-2485(-)
MNYGHSQIKLLMNCLSQSSTLIALHFSDCGIRDDKELFFDILEFFQIPEETVAENLGEWCKLNRLVKNPQRLRDIIKSYTAGNPMMEANFTKNKVDRYKEYMLQSKQGRHVQTNRIVNQMKMGNGIGRLESNLIDEFVVTRRLNHSELIFN